jgi:tetraacyldisaccharide 4'-kinase
MNALERSWYQRWGWSYLLWPLSVVMALLSGLRRLAYRRGWLASSHPGLPVVVIGNISVGGTGKTPFTLWLCEYLQQQGLKPAIISRGYGAKIHAPVLVDAGQHEAYDVGDEPLLLATLSQVPVVVCPDRQAAAAFVRQHTDANIILSDDGLQHYALARDLEIIMLDGQRGVGNGLLLPAGPLREGRWRLTSADVVLATSVAEPEIAANDAVHDISTPSLTEHHMWLQSAPALPVSCLMPSALSSATATAALCPPCSVTLVAGIGNPHRFVRSAQQQGYRSSGEYFFPDHYAFTASDFSAMAGPVLMTAKDAVKCRRFAQADWYYLPLQARFAPRTLALIDQQIATLRSRYGL